MIKAHIIAQGESIGSIAIKYGFHWRTIWDDPQNQALKDKRQNPNILLPGDEVVIPEKKQTKKYTLETGKRHVFIRKGVPSHIRLKVVADGQPVANAPFTLTIDGKSNQGKTDAEGLLDVTIVPDGKQGRIVVEVPKGKIVYNLNLGHLDPITEPTGAIARLKSLGYDTADAEKDPALLKDLLGTFQRCEGLSESGELDQVTRNKLNERYGG